MTDLARTILVKHLDRLARIDGYVIMIATGRVETGGPLRFIVLQLGKILDGVLRPKRMRRQE